MIRRLLNNATIQRKAGKNELISLINLMICLWDSTIRDPIIHPVTTSFGLHDNCNHCIYDVWIWCIKLWNGQKMSITFRKAFVKILIASVMVPFGIHLWGQKGLSWTVEAHLITPMKQKEQSIIQFEYL